MADEDETPEQRARRKIHERRNRFVAAALASTGLAAGCEDDKRPGVCLSIAYDYDAGTVHNPDPVDSGPPLADAAPQVCLSFAIPEDAGSEDGGGDDQDGG